MGQKMRYYVNISRARGAGQERMIPLQQKRRNMRGPALLAALSMVLTAVPAALAVETAAGTPPAVTEAPYSDVPAEAWYAPFAADLKQDGAVSGYEDGTFKPTCELSRQEAAVILQRLYTVLYGKIEVSPTLYADNGSIGVWAKDSVYAMRQTGIMQGVGANRFDPKNGYTCEQSIITMLRMTQKA